MGKFVKETFPQAVNDALEAVHRILDTERDPRIAEKVEHEYVDKYLLADQVTNMTLISLMNVFERMGLTKKHLEKILTADSSSSSKTLRFQASDSCKFLKEQVVNVTVDGETNQVLSTEETTTASGNNGGGGSASIASASSSTRSSFAFRTVRSSIQKVVKEVKEFHWNVDVQWELALYSGPDIKTNKQVLSSRTTSMVVVVQSDKKAPLPEYRDHDPIELPVTWFFQQVDIANSKSKFSIDRTVSKTPRRNDQVQDAFNHFELWKNWALKVRQYFVSNLQKDIVEKHNPAIITADSNSMPMLSSVSSTKVFVPILPLFEESTTKPIAEGGSAEPTTTTTPTANFEQKSSFSLPEDVQDQPSNRKTPLLSLEDMHRFLNEQIRSLQEKMGSLERFFPNKNHVKLHSVAEATFSMLCLHIADICRRYTHCLDYLERMLEEQLVAAIGKRVTPDDLDTFCKYHYAKIFTPGPVPFCHAIRQPGYFPVGMISIESSKGSGSSNGGDMNDMEPIETFVRTIVDTGSNGARALKVPLNAATTAELTGPIYLHGWVNQRFQAQKKSYELIARARQFSSFMLIIGTMTGTNCLKPKEAIILRNKDEVVLPLILNEIPSAQEFKDAIQSLSPEQQRFSKAFRNMQLESSVFGICVVQIKPQLETLLGLPADALTKEMKLTEELMELFCEYQVPSDLLSFNGPDANASVEGKIENVKAHVKSVLDVIGNAKVSQLELATMKADMAKEAAIADDPSIMSVPVIVHQSTPLSIEERERILLRKLNRASPTPTAMAFPNTEMMAVNTDYLFMSKRSHSTMRQVAPETIQTTPQTSRSIFPDAAGKPSASSSASEGFDITQVPKQLDATIEKHIVDSTLRTTVIKIDDNWTRLRQENLLTQPKSSTMSFETIKAEKNKAFDLLDALSRSGSLPIAFSELHVITCVTHSFEKNVMNTLIQDNINPIEKLEMSALLVASAIHGKPASALIEDDQERGRLASNFPSLLGAPSEND